MHYLTRNLSISFSIFYSLLGFSLVQNHFKIITHFFRIATKNVIRRALSNRCPLPLMDTFAFIFAYSFSCISSNRGTTSSIKLGDIPWRCSDWSRAWKCTQNSIVIECASQEYFSVIVQILTFLVSSYLIPLWSPLGDM